MSFLFVNDLSAKEQMEILQGWYYSSCHLAFVYAISSNSPDHALQYITLIDQMD